MALSDTIILVISIIILIVAGVLNILAAQKLSGSTDTYFLKARSELIWAAVIIFVGLFFIIIMYGVSFYFSRQAVSSGQANTISRGGKMTLIIMIVISFILILASGILSIMASINLRKSTNFATAGASGKAYNYSIGAAVTSIAGMTITLLVYLILIFIRKPSIVQAVGTQYTAFKQKLGGTSAGQVIVETRPVPDQPVVVRAAPQPIVFQAPPPLVQRQLVQPIATMPPVQRAPTPPVREGKSAVSPVAALPAASAPPVSPLGAANRAPQPAVLAPSAAPVTRRLPYQEE